MQPQPTVMVSQPNVVANGGSSLTVGVKYARGLGITQIVIGGLNILLGILTIALLNHWVGYVGFAIWGGIWILVGGIFGVCSAANSSSAGLNWTNMAFAIVSACVMCIDLIIYCFAVRNMQYYHYICISVHRHPSNCYYTSNSAGVAIYSCLLALTIAEFAIALTVAISCCKYGCSGCCNEETRTMVAQQPHMVPTSVVVQSSAPPTSYQVVYPATSYPVAYPVASYPAASYPAASYPAASYPAASYPAASYPHAFASTALPVYAGQQQGAYTSTGNAASAQPVAMTHDPNIPQEKQPFLPPSQ